MNPIKTDPCNLTFTLEGCDDLPAAMGDGFVATYWQPDEDELRALAEGLPVRVCLRGAGPPRPMMLDVEDPKTGKIAGQGGVRLVVRADPGERESFLLGAIGVVEVDRYSHHALWADNDRRGDVKLSWSSNSDGLADTAGYLSGFPVVVTLWSAVVDGKKLIFVEPTSRVVDHDLIRTYLEKVMPWSAKRPNGKLNITDAVNFHNVLR